MAHELILQATQHDDEQELTLGTPQSDTWSFASTFLELLTLKLPYHSLNNDIHVLTAILARKLPFLPPSASTSPRRGESVDGASPSPAVPIESNYFSEVYKWPGVWELCKNCWDLKPRRRPTMGTVVRRLGEIRRKGPYDHNKRTPPHNTDLYGPKRLLSPTLEEANVARKSPRLLPSEIPDSGRLHSPLRTSSSASISVSESRSRSPRTPTLRVGALYSPEEIVRKQRPSRLSFSSTPTDTDSPSSSSYGLPYSARVHPYNYHSSAFKRIPHRRSPSSGNLPTTAVSLHASCPPSVGPSRVPSSSNVMPQLHHSQSDGIYPGVGRSSSGYPTPSLYPQNPIRAFPEHNMAFAPHNHDPQVVSGYTASDTPYREGSAHLAYSNHRITQGHRQILSTHSVPQSYSSESHHMTSQLFPLDSHLPNQIEPATRRSTLSSASSGSFVQSPSPPSTYYDPVVHTVDAGHSPFNGGYYNHDTTISSQPLTQGSEEEDSSVDFAMLEHKYLDLSQNTTPDNSPKRSVHPSQPYPPRSIPPHHRVPETLGIRMDFLDKHTSLDDFIAQTPSPTDEAVEAEHQLTRAASERYKDRMGEQQAPAVMNDRPTMFHHHMGYPSTTHPFSSTHSRPGSIRPMFTQEFTDSPGMRGRSVPPDSTPSLRPDLTLITPIVKHKELFDEEALEIEEESDEGELPPDSIMSKASDDFDEETDVEADGEDDMFNSIIPLGFNVEDEFSDDGCGDNGLGEGVGLFGGRVDDQYWRQEELQPRTSNGNSHPSYYPPSGDSTPRQENIHLPTAPMGLGIRLSAS